MAVANRIFRLNENFENVHPQSLRHAGTVLNRADKLRLHLRSGRLLTQPSE